MAVRVVVGKATPELTPAEFAERRAAYRELVVDVGTGDGKHVLAVARARPEALRPLGHWYERQQRHWSDAFDRLEAVIAAETPKRRKS